MKKLTINELILFFPILTVLPLINGIFYKLGYLVPFDLEFFVSSFSYTELALSSYSSILITLVSLFAYSLMKLEHIPKISIKLIFFINISYIFSYYIFTLKPNFIELTQVLMLINTFWVFSIKKEVIIRLTCVFLLIVVCPILSGFKKYYEFPLEASNKIVLKNDPTEWYLVEKVGDKLILVDKKTLESKKYVFKFIEMKDVEKMESKLWGNLSKAS